jgi:hypothetical protein
MQKWTYYVARLHWRKKRTGEFTRISQEDYFFEGQTEYSLEDGLAHMGEAGYELVAVHPTYQEPGQAHANYIYVFKRLQQSGQDESKPQVG